MANVHLIVCLLLASVVAAKRYEPNWKSLDTRPRPVWFDDAKIGLQIHWGVYSVPSISDQDQFPHFQEEWFEYFWKVSKEKYITDFMKKYYPPDFTYADFAAKFTAELYNPDQWADIFQASGAKYIAITAKHHEGFCMWPSKYSFNWNSMDTGPKRDLIGDLAKSLRNRTNVRFGIYHSLFEWFNPIFNMDKDNKFQTQYFVEQKVMPALHELVNNYQPELIWSDGDWLANSTYWNSTHFLAWLYSDSPVKDTIVVNDRWGKDANCKHGDYFNCGIDKWNPRKKQPFYFEDIEDMDLHSFGFRRNMVYSDVRTMKSITRLIASVVSCGGNLMLNVGPTWDGRIIPIFEERLRQMGSWLNVNAEGIYGTRTWHYQEDNVTQDVWYTKKDENVYAIALNWPRNGTLDLGGPIPTASTNVTLLGYSGHSVFSWKFLNPQGISIKIPVIPAYDMPCEWAWVFKFTNLKNAY